MDNRLAAVIVIYSNLSRQITEGGSGCVTRCLKKCTPILENANTLEKQYFQCFNNQNIDFQRQYDHFSEIGVQKNQTLYYQQNKLETPYSATTLNFCQAVQTTAQYRMYTCTHTQNTMAHASALPSSAKI